MNYALLATFLLQLMPAQAQESELSCSLSQSELVRIEQLREAMAVVDLVIGPEDVATGIGLGVIDSSCLTGPHQEFRAETVRSIQAGIGRAIEQSQICFDLLRIIEMPDVISVLGRTRFRCSEATGDGLVASMRRTSRTYDSCGTPTSRFMAGAHRRYEMTLTAPIAGAPAKINDSASTRLQIDELASFLAHEAMHVLAMNNRDWHNNFLDDERPLTGCGPSRFEDRIYFTQAACFPQSELGQVFYAEDGPAQCPDLCLRALTEIDPEAALMYSASTEPGAERTSAFGPSQVARPYPLEEARRICQRIRENLLSH